MAATTAERQRAFRRSKAERIATPEQDNARLPAWQADALAEVQRPTTQACRHPPAAVEVGTCHACGTDVW